MKELLNLFCSTDQMRLWMNSPFIVKDLLVATDGYMLICKDKDDNDCLRFDERQNKESAILSLLKDDNMSFKIQTSKLIDLISKVDKVDDVDVVGSYIDCDCCDGDGYVDVEFEHGLKTYNINSECPVCDGDGLTSNLKEVPNGKRIIDTGAVCKIKESLFSVSNFNKLIDVANYTKSEYIELVYQEQANYASIFKVGYFKVLLMPLTFDNKKISFTLK